MAKKQASLPDYWSLYRAINFWRFSKDRKYIDAKTEKEMTYSFIGEEMFQKSVFMPVFSTCLWMSFPLLVIFLSLIFAIECPASFFVGALVIVGYHFAGMYYMIRGPHIQISEVKKGFFK